MIVIRFAIQGSAKEPYITTFNNHGDYFTGGCSCPAGIHRTLCKHIISILNGEAIKGIVSDNIEKVTEVANWAKNTPAEGMINDLSILQIEEKALNKKVLAVKAKLKTQKEELLNYISYNN